MNVEGLGPIITPELIQATATGLPMLVLAYWLVVWVGDLWRVRAWTAAGAEVSCLAGLLGAPVRPVYGGWRVGTAAAYVDYTGGIHGPRTGIAWVRSDATVLEWREGWLPAAQAKEVLDATQRKP